jgi:hypothetical protein
MYYLDLVRGIGAALLIAFTAYWVGYFIGEEKGEQKK